MNNLSSPPGYGRRYMPEKTPQSSVGSTIAICSGIIVMLVPIMVCAFNPNISIAVAVVVGAILGAPLVLLGFRLHPNSSNQNDSVQRFCPTRMETWGILGSLAYAACSLIRFAIFGAAVLLFPPGDNWGTVGLRLSLLVLAAGGVYWWVNFTRRKLPDLFRGKLSDETLGALTREEQGDEQKTATGAVLKNWELPLIAILAFCVAFGVIDFNNPWLNMNGASPRARGLVRLIAWCCGNPNTLVSLSVLVGLGALGLYSYRIVRAAIQYKGVPETKGM